MLRIARGEHKPAADEPIRWYVPEAAAGRIEELEGMLHNTKAMLDEIAHAAGFGLGDSYSAGSVIARLRGVETDPSMKSPTAMSGFQK